LNSEKNAGSLPASPQQITVEKPGENGFGLADLKTIFQKWLAIEQDTEVLDIVLAAAIDRKVSGDPLWMFLVGPSGATKSELLRSLQKSPSIFHLSSLTGKTIVSGKERKDGSIVKGLYSKMNGKIVVIPELSQVLTKSREERDQIFSQLRDLYDGHLSCGYGTTNELIVVDCLIGLICGVTPAIDMYGSVHAVLGERFLKVRPQFNRDVARERALMNQQELDTMREELSRTVNGFLENLPINEPTLSKEVLERVGLYAEFVAQVRTTVTSQAFREYDTSEWSPEPEFATRLAQQLLKLARSLAIVRGHNEVTGEDLATVSRVALDTCIPNRLKVVKALTQTSEALSIAAIATASGLTWVKAKNSIECLNTIGIVKESNGEKQHNERWYSLKDEFRALITRLASIPTNTK
jgi:hypothetical protein